MNDDDLYGPRLSAVPTTAPIVRGAAAALVTVSLAVAGCSESHAPGVIVVDAGISVAPDSGAPGVDAGNPGLGVIDAGLTVPPDSGNPGANPGLVAFDAGIDAGNPGDAP